jgi:uncharacterized membrane protein
MPTIFTAIRAFVDPGSTAVNYVIAFFSILVFIAGLWCYGLAFQMPNDTLSMLVFIGGVLFIPWQIVGHSRK